MKSLKTIKVYKWRFFSPSNVITSFSTLKYSLFINLPLKHINSIYCPRKDIFHDFLWLCFTILPRLTLVHHVSWIPFRSLMSHIHPFFMLYKDLLISYNSYSAVKDFRSTLLCFYFAIRFDRKIVKKEKGCDDSSYQASEILSEDASGNVKK